VDITKKPLFLATAVDTPILTVEPWFSARDGVVAVAVEVLRKTKIEGESVFKSAFACDTATLILLPWFSLTDNNTAVAVLTLGVTLDVAVAVSAEEVADAVCSGESMFASAITLMFGINAEAIETPISWSILIPGMSLLNHKIQ